MNDIPFGENAHHVLSIAGANLLAEARNNPAIDCTGLTLLDVPVVEEQADGSFLIRLTIGESKAAVKKGSKPESAHGLPPSYATGLVWELPAEPSEGV